MKRACTALVGLIIVLAMAGTAQAKGAMPQSAQITGPGLDKPMNFGDPGRPTGISGKGDINLLTSQTKLLETLFGGNQMQAPHGALGPRYLITWTMRSDMGSKKTFQVRSDLYPYAKGGVVVFTHGGQKIPFGDGSHTLRSGWATGYSALRANLQAWGLPQRNAATGSGVQSSAISPLWIVPVAFLALIVAAGVWARRRTAQVQTGPQPAQRSA
jgi:hypothetical protein